MTQPQVITPTSQDAALLAAWQRFLDYDQVSSEQKANYQRLREVVIALGLLTSAGAVFSIYLLQATTTPWLQFGLLPTLFTSLKELLRVLLIIMPIASVTLMRYASQFATSTSWIEYRVGAETIRSHIYRYRLGAGGYEGLDAIAACSKLLDSIDFANNRIDEQGATVPFMNHYDKIEDLIAQKTSAVQKDLGFNDINIADYIEWRVRPQLSWYIGKIRRDYSTLQREQSLALAVGAAGAVLSGFGQNLEALVAVTTAMGIALTTRSETRMYGATYGIFHFTAEKLQIELNRWQILSDEEKLDPHNQREFVERVEEIFDNEQELWRSQAVQSQSTNDQTISQQLQRTIGTEQVAKFAAAGLPLPAGVPTDDAVATAVDYSRTQAMAKVVIPDSGSIIPPLSTGETAAVVVTESSTITTSVTSDAMGEIAAVETVEEVVKTAEVLEETIEAPDAANGAVSETEATVEAAQDDDTMNAVG